jgi:hypothetical protein
LLLQQYLATPITRMELPSNDRLLTEKRRASDDSRQWAGVGPFLKPQLAKVLSRGITESRRVDLQYRHSVTRIMSSGKKTKPRSDNLHVVEG